MYISFKASSRPQGKYMHHTHVHGDLLLVYILFVRETHEHEGIFPTSISLALMHITKTHVTHCLLWHATCINSPYMYAIMWWWIIRVWECINMSEQAMSCMCLGYTHQGKWYRYWKYTFMFMNLSWKKNVPQQEIFMHMSVMHILTLWSWASFGRDELEKTGLDNTRTL